MNLNPEYLIVGFLISVAGFTFRDLYRRLRKVEELNERFIRMEVNQQNLIKTVDVLIGEIRTSMESQARYISSMCHLPAVQQCGNEERCEK